MTTSCRQSAAQSDATYVLRAAPEGSGDVKVLLGTSVGDLGSKIRRVSGTGYLS